MSLRYDRSHCVLPISHEYQPVVKRFSRKIDVALQKALLSAKQPAPSFLSIVVPSRNEAASLNQLIDEIVRALRPLCCASRQELAGFEIVIVDDASNDQTQSVLRDLVAAYPELRNLLLANRVGQSAAIMAGIHAATGEWIATLDADLQNDPADLVRLWRALPGDNGAVLGWRYKRQDVWSKRLISFWANRLRNVVLGQSIRDTGCSIRIFPRRLALRFPLFHGMHRFFGSLLLREGCDLVQLPVHHRIRSHGQSHYGFWNRSLQVAVDLLGVAWLMNRPLHYQIFDTWTSIRTMPDTKPDIMLSSGTSPALSHFHLEN